MDITARSRHVNPDRIEAEQGSLNARVELEFQYVVNQLFRAIWKKTLLFPINMRVEIEEDESGFILKGTLST